MKKALLVTTISGFVPQFEMNNVYILQEMGYEVHYASNFHCPHYGFDNHRLEGTGIICHQVDFVRSPFCILKNKKAYKQLLMLLENSSFEILHCHTPMGGVLGRLAARSFQKKRKKTIKVCYTAHGFHFFHGAPLWNWIFYYPIERWLAHYTDRLITINEEDYRRAKKFHLHRRMGELGKVEKINGVGIDIKYIQDYLSSSKKREKIQKEKEIGRKKCIFLSVGELNRNKNHKIMLQALAKNKTNICYMICGDGPYRAVLEHLIKKYRLKDQVKLLGYRDDILELLEFSDIFVLPSFREGLSLSLQEAMVCGLPVIASDIRGNRELIESGKGGWLVDPKDKKELRKVIKEVEEMPLAERVHIGVYNYNKIQNYDKNIVIKQMKEIYNSLLIE